MRQLYINNHLAVMAESDNFTLHRENPFFTNAGDYTFEVSLPLEGCAQNQRIFGSLHRMETAVAPFVGKKYDFRLVVPPLFLTGTAIITSITDTDIRIQLLAGTSGFNADTIEERGKDIYIDEMDLGKAYENTYPDAYAKGDRYKEGGVYYSPRNRLLAALYKEQNKDILYGLNSQTECVNFPIFSSSDDAKTNDKYIYHVEMTGKPTDNKYMVNSNEQGLNAHFAAQPFLVNILENVIKQLGYHIKSNAIRGTWMENIFIANAKNEYRYNRILPHWTVKEFLEEIRRFFGVFFFVNEKEVDIISRSDFYSKIDNMTILKDVIDDKTVELSEDEDSNDISVGNIGYDHPSMDDMLQLPDEVWENAIIIKKPFESSLLQWIHDNIKEGEKDKSAWIFVDEDTSNTYAYLQSAKDSLYYLSQVDCCPALIRRGEQYGPDKRDVDVALRIVPAKMTFANIDYATYIYNGKVVENKRYPNQVALPMLTTENTREEFLTIFSVDAAINEMSQNQNNENDLSCIEVALATGETYRTSFDNGHGVQMNVDVPMALGIAYVKSDEGFYIPVICAGNHNEFKLNNKKAPSIYNSVLNAHYKIDTRCKHIIEFVDDGIFSPNKVFLIRGKKYACEKIEYSVSADGIDRKKKGHFYEIG